MRVKDLLQSGITELRRLAVVEFSTDARLLLESCLGMSRTEIFLLQDSEVDTDRQKRFYEFIERRKKREPIAYILGQCEFWSLPFSVTPDVLIPRPETEFLLDRVLSLSQKSNFRSGRILDLCTGSGVIAVVLARETGEKVVAIDISTGALRIARFNGCSHTVPGSIDFVQADLFSALSENRRFSLIVSNPPYVSRFDLENSLESEVALFEPHIALDGGEKGLEIICRIRKTVPCILQPGGEIFIEIGADQGDDVRRIFETSMDDFPDFKLVEILADYSGRDRVVHGVLDD